MKVAFVNWSRTWRLILACSIKESVWLSKPSLGPGQDAPRGLWCITRSLSRSYQTYCWRTTNGQQCSCKLYTIPWFKNLLSQDPLSLNLNNKLVLTRGVLLATKLTSFVSKTKAFIVNEDHEQPRLERLDYHNQERQADEAAIIALETMISLWSFDISPSALIWEYNRSPKVLQTCGRCFSRQVSNLATLFEIFFIHRPWLSDYLSTLLIVNDVRSVPFRALLFQEPMSRKRSYQCWWPSGVEWIDASKLLMRTMSSMTFVFSPFSTWASLASISWRRNMAESRSFCISKNQSSRLFTLRVGLGRRSIFP